MAWEGDLEGLKSLISKDKTIIDMNLENKETILTLAAYQGHTELVKYLISEGADINKRNKWENNAFLNAAQNGNAEIGHMLLDNGSNVNDKGSEGNSPLHFAAMNESPEFVELLLNNGADVNRMNNYGQPPVLYASWNGNDRILAGLLNKGADVNFKTTDENSVLHNLARVGNIKSIVIAVEKGAGVNVTDKDGKLPLHYAAINGHSEVVGFLASKTDDINTKEETLGNTALHISAINGDIKSTKLLLKAGADPTILNSGDKKPLDYAVKYGYVDLVSYYIEMNLAQNLHVDLAQQSREEANKKLVDGQARIVYAGHSGWIVQTENNVLVFDYWVKSLNPDKCLANGSFCEKEMKNKNVYVFVSHDHTDHFDKAIYNWADKVKNITYIYGFKPEESWVYQNTAYDGPDYQYINNNETKKINDIVVTTIKSNDTGQGFLVELDGLSIFHPGDHAMFTAEDGDVFRKEVDFIAEKCSQVDVAFLPVTGCPSRWKKEYIIEGFFYNIDKLNPQQVFPMHAFQREYLLKEFSELAEERNNKANIVCTENRGDNFMYIKSFTASK